ncbi:MAG: MBL fold metallo-hydrolase [Chloroflexi bacterium]|nr:MBL fold metallo-hydrolase [Chloroflexota bacterium]
MQVVSLASGSSGNATLVQGESGALLIDAGISQRSVVQRITQLGTPLETLRGIVITHEHGDHITSAVALAQRYHVPIFASHGTLHALAVASHIRTVPLQALQPLLIDDIHITPIPVSHDAAEPMAIKVQLKSVCAVIATDLGVWDECLVDACTDADLVVIEANHERERLHLSSYAPHLKLRIASARGHLDNIQAGLFLARIAHNKRRRHAWLAHLSQEANSGDLAIRSVRTVLRMHQAEQYFATITPLPRNQHVVWGAEQRSSQSCFLDDL